MLNLCGRSGRHKEICPWSCNKDEASSSENSLVPVVTALMKVSPETKKMPPFLKSNEGHKSLFTSKIYFPQMEILYLHLDLKLGTIFTPRETLVLETQFYVKFSKYHFCTFVLKKRYRS